ncbi:MAG: UDP-N-acetylmuramoyl-L-alanine--D-glutamate ligase, partial [Bacteroidota bacterium]|nr:UDP-N-acetylmuramoyl-L-alanine--D-glutamate ligase [Bacteroidota bacterium]
MTKKAVILGAGESGLGAALLAKAQGYEVWVSDGGKIHEAFRDELNVEGIAFEESGHTLEKILDAEVVVKSPG